MDNSKPMFSFTKLFHTLNSIYQEKGIFLIILPNFIISQHPLILKKAFNF